MNKNLKKPILDTRQFIGLLLALFSIAAFLLVYYRPTSSLPPPPHSRVHFIQSADAAVGSADVIVNQTLGFTVPLVETLRLPVVCIMVFLALLNLLLGFKKNPTLSDA
jgi:hypothetical protein